MQSLGSPQAELDKSNLAKHPVAMDPGVLPSQPKQLGADDPFFFFFLFASEFLTYSLYLLC